MCMKNDDKAFFALMVVLVIVFLVGSCKYVAPSVSKAGTEIEQLEELKKQNKLLEQQNIILTRIAVTLENKK